MKHRIPTFALLLAATAVQAQQAPQVQEESSGKPENLQQFLEANPQFKGEFEQLQKQNIRIRMKGEDPATAAAANFKGSASTAEDAYNRGDYETAMQHYKALAAEGDGRASLMIGIMHQQGQGVEKDKGSAYAWYGRASEQGDGAAGEIVRGMNDNDELSKKEYDAAAEKYRELSRELDGEEAAQRADSRFDEIKGDTNVYVRPRSR